MGKKQKWWDRLEFVTRNITASMDATDADVRDLTDRMNDAEPELAQLRSRVNCMDDGLNALLETVGTLADSVEKLLHMQDSTKNISKTHTLWLERLGRRVGDLEERLSPPEEAVKNDYVYTCPACDRSFSFYSQRTMDEYVQNHAAAHQLRIEYADRTQKDDVPHIQELIDFGLWLSEELTGTPISRTDLESCLTDWKASR